MAAGPTYEPIATYTLGSAAANVTFSSISGSYTDLILVANNLVDTNGYCFLRYNNDSGSNYSRTFIVGTGSAANSFRSSNQTQIDFNARTSGTGYLNKLQIMNYSNTTTYKSALIRSDMASAETDAFVTLWRSTSAITEINIISPSGSGIQAGSTFTLYGISAA